MSNAIRAAMIVLIALLLMWIWKPSGRDLLALEHRWPRLPAAAFAAFVGVLLLAGAPAGVTAAAVALRRGENVAAPMCKVSCYCTAWAIPCVTVVLATVLVSPWIHGLMHSSFFHGIACSLKVAPYPFDCRPPGLLRVMARYLELDIRGRVLVTDAVSLLVLSPFLVAWFRCLTLGFRRIRYAWR